MQETVVAVSCEQMGEFENYLYERENAEATIRKYLTDIRTFFRYLGDNLAINKKRLLAYKEWLKESYMINSANSLLAALNQFLEFLGMGIRKVKRFKVQKNLFLNEEEELTEAEFRKLLKAAVAEGKYQLALCMETIESTGIRIIELEAFTVEAVRNDFIEVTNKGKYRRIYLSKEIRKKLLRYAKEQEIHSGPIFITRSGKPKSRSNIWREMKALKEKAGIDGRKIFPHNLRHLFARIYYKATKDLAGLGDILGHSSLNITRIYTSNTGKQYQRQLDNLNYLHTEMNT